MMIILGVWDGHDSGAALLVNGEIGAACNEERFTRRKLEVRFPEHSIAACLSIAGLAPSQVDALGVSTIDPAKALARLAPWTKEQYYLVRRRKADPGALSGLTRRAKYRMTEWPPIAASSRLSRWSLRRSLARLGLGGARLDLFDHHECHAVAAAYGSGLDRAAVITIDGLGDGLSATASRFRDGALERVAASPASHSLGVFFEHVTALLNMRELEDEGKVMALADYASPVPDEDNALLPLVRVVDGRLHVSPSGAALRKRLARVLWHVPNEQFAYMAQRVVEKTCVDLAQDAVARTGERQVVVAGGVASNIKAMRAIRLSPGVDRVVVFPHVGDGGLALGAAVAMARKERVASSLDLSSVAFGPAFDAAHIRKALDAAALDWEACDSIETRVADLLADRAVVLWFQGRMEYGPRALGHRSVLARPDVRELRDRLNLVLKRRVWYQPFCPSMLRSEAVRVLADWDGEPLSNPHMTMAYGVRAECRESMAGVIGVDGSCRPQIVPDEAPGPFPRLLHALRTRIGQAIVLNTSCNIHGEPLVCTPEQAADMFVRCGADALAIGSFLATRGRRA